MMTAITDMPLPMFNESRKRGLLLLSVFLFPIVFTSLLFMLVALIADIDFNVISHETKFAKIETPANRSIVSKQFEIAGSLETPLPDHSYYLLEYRNKRFWPKYSFGNKAMQWNKALTHRAKKNEFSNYQIVMADAALKQIFDNWFKTSKQTGKYPGIEKSSIQNISEKVVANIKVKTQ